MSGGTVQSAERRRTRTPAQPDQPFRLTLLGGWELQASGEAVAMSSSGQRLLALLALRGRTQRDYAAGILWPESDDQNALANLRTTLWRVRQRARGAVISTQHEIELAPLVSLDIDGLVAAGRYLLEDGSGDSPGDCAEIGRDLANHAPLLPGWYDDWVLTERERLQQLQVHALEVAAERLVQSRHLASALEIAQAATQVEPFRETAHCAVVKVLLQQANPAQAVRHYRRYENLLDRELGIRPSDHLRNLVRPVLTT
ncbi:BTAD domain-containing putative transcriptional regulator [Saccharopolyspora oryzae]|uniref:BTAD domain-containing putative transcriptional regulator n=1 Tax=Saccharopolyspora oryzae TaxID=2997343 RepID=A0ABT4V3M0_9PSEU|nr:BTAD domain-containing putative transcriptional regulator [Saccharopolyspora oryzae]MDA3628558.1 BTAD domain-containing putative transcriptional regulator [Saccharopolyspora oryzae]